jgi:hypothetical protein
MDMRKISMSQTTELPEIPNENQFIYTYQFEVVFYNDTVKVEPVLINHVHKESNFSENFNPIYLMSIDVKKTDLLLLKRHQKDLMASITLKSNQYMRLGSGESSGNEVTSLISSEIVSSGVFEPIFSQTAFDEKFKEEEIENKELNIDDNWTSVSRDTDRASLDVQFEDIIAVNSKKTPFNLVVDKGATIGSILQYIIDVLPVKGALVDMPDNDYSLGETIIPPGNLVPTLKTMQYTIGIYENGLLAFYDDDILYILNKYAMEHECKENEKIITNVYVTELDKMLGGVTVRGKDPVSQEPTYIGPIIIKTQDNEVLSGELDGNNFIFSSFRQGLSAVKYHNNEPVSDMSKPVSMVMKRNIETYKHSIDKNIVDYDELANLYNMASYFNELESNVKQASLQLENINIIDFKPNKLVHLHFLDLSKDIRLSGIYHINTVITKFFPVNNTQTNEMFCIGNMSLTRRAKG